MSNTDLKYPNVFVLGVPRAGTTSIHYAFSSRGDMSVSSTKEPGYLHYCNGAIKRFNGPDDNIATIRKVHDYADYASLFDWQRKFVVDVTPSYFSDREALSNIAEKCQSPKVIVVLRDPVGRAYSHYSKFKSLGRESLSFLDALAEGSERVSAGWNYNWDYVQQSSYSSNLLFCIDKFGADNVHVVFYNDIVSDSAGELLSMLKFLGADTEDVLQLDKTNLSGVYKSGFYKACFDFIDAYKYRVRKILPAIILNRILPCFHKVKSNVTVKNESLSVADRKAAQAFFAEDIANLEKLVGRDLSAWKS